MTPTTLLADLQARGVRLYLAGDELRYKAKPGVMTPDLAAVIKPHKPALLAHLREEAVAVAWRIEAMRPQIPERGPIPLLVAVSGIPPSPSACVSCGEAFTPTGSSPRCHRCTVAAQRALGLPVSASSVATVKQQVEQPEERSSLDMFMAPYPDDVPRAS
ncbi:MAG: hypothetical protein M3Q71_19515 [Chloroflexota bacterium]|nr:hypothetical protein [Chloroflexota bacterium]